MLVVVGRQDHGDHRGCAALQHVLHGVAQERAVLELAEGAPHHHDVGLLVVRRRDDLVGRRHRLPDGRPGRHTQLVGGPGGLAQHAVGGVARAVRRRCCGGAAPGRRPRREPEQAVGPRLVGPRGGRAVHHVGQHHLGAEVLGQVQRHLLGGARTLAAGDGHQGAPVGRRQGRSQLPGAPDDDRGQLAPAEYVVDHGRQQAGLPVDARGAGVGPGGPDHDHAVAELGLFEHRSDHVVARDGPDVVLALVEHVHDGHDIGGGAVHLDGEDGGRCRFGPGEVQHLGGGDRVRAAPAGEQQALGADQQVLAERLLPSQPLLLLVRTPPAPHRQPEGGRRRDRRHHGQEDDDRVGRRVEHAEAEAHGGDHDLQGASGVEPGAEGGALAVGEPGELGAREGAGELGDAGEAQDHHGPHEDLSLGEEAEVDP